MITTQEDENDETLPDPPLWRVVKASAPEWYLILVGVIASAAEGVSFPLISIFMGRIFEVHRNIFVILISLYLVN